MSKAIIDKPTKEQEGEVIAGIKSRMGDLITVCDYCLHASCWQGILMCAKSRDAGTTQKTRAELADLDRENSGWWKTDTELCNEANTQARWLNRRRK